MAVAGWVIREMPRIFRRLESFGVDFKDRVTGDYYRLRSFGLPGTYHIICPVGAITVVFPEQMVRSETDGVKLLGKVVE